MLKPGPAASTVNWSTEAPSAGIPQFTLSHGQTKLVLTSLGYASGITSKTFDYYIKSLRKLGVPFEKPAPNKSGRQLARYNFYHLMELCLALTLRVYWTLPDAVLQGIVDHRPTLYKIYNTAYIEADAGVGSPIRITASAHRSFIMRGVYLDPQIHYGGGRLLSMGVPKVMSPFEALQLFGTDQAASRTHLPLNLSSLALRVVDHAGRVPQVRPGPSNRSLGTHRSDAEQPTGALAGTID